MIPIDINSLLNLKEILNHDSKEASAYAVLETDSGRKLIRLLEEEVTELPRLDQSDNEIRANLAQRHLLNYIRTLASDHSIKVKLEKEYKRARNAGDVVAKAWGYEITDKNPYRFRGTSSAESNLPDETHWSFSYLTKDGEHLRESRSIRIYENKAFLLEAKHDSGGELTYEVLGEYRIDGRGNVDMPAAAKARLSQS